MDSFFGMYWAQPQAIWYAPILVVCIVVLLWNHRRITRGVRQLVDALHQKKLFPRASLRRRRFKAGLLIVALTFIFIALLRPQWGKKERVIEQQGRDVLVVLDISRSMLAQDVRPNRLEFTKLKIRNLLSRLKAERVGLILFSGTAFVQCPLTIDHDAFLMFLDQVDVETIASGTTAIDKALLEAMKVFKQIPGRKNKLIVLATDGEDFSLHLEQVKRMARDEKVRLFALGVGSEQGAPIPILDIHGKQIGHEKDKDGKVVLSLLNEKMLKGMAQQLGGLYVRASYYDGDIEQITQAIKRFEKEKFEDKKISLYEDRYPLLLGVAWILLALEWIL
jgi:Ca-activated chloride channel family protein